MSDNKRVYYATKGLAIRKNGLNNNRYVQPMNNHEQGQLDSQPRQENYGLGGPSTSGFWEIPRGVQSVGITTTFNLEDVFQQGQLNIYEKVEDRPEIEVTVSRVLDGTHPLYLMCTYDADNTVPSGAYGLAARNNGYNVDMALAVYNDDVSHASGVAGRPAVSRVLASGMFLSSLTYTFPVDGNATEEATFVGNNKYWSTDSTVAGSATLDCFPDENLISTDEDPSTFTTNRTTTTAFTLTDGTFAGITRREDLYIDNQGPTGSFSSMVASSNDGHDGNNPVGPLVSRFPNEIPTNDRDCIQNISVSVDLGQEEILCLGSKTASTRYVTFPVEVTCSFECVTADGDMIEAAEDTSLSSQTIVIVTKQGLVLDLGTNNKLASIDFSGGDTGGGNVTVTYNYTNSNELIVRHARFV